MTKKLKALWLRLRHPRGMRGYLYNLVLIHRGVPVYTSLVRFHYGLNVDNLVKVERQARAKYTVSSVSTLSITPLDEYSHTDPYLDDQKT